MSKYLFLYFVFVPDDLRQRHLYVTYYYNLLSLIIFLRHIPRYGLSSLCNGFTCLDLFPASIAAKRLLLLSSATTATCAYTKTHSLYRAVSPIADRLTCISNRFIGINSSTNSFSARCQCTDCLTVQKS